jgi:hypothetical protein
MSGAVTEPYMVHDLHALAGELLLGKWCVYRWEHCGPDREPATWKAALAEKCRATGVDVDFIDIPRKNVTVAVNTERLPTLEQVTDSVSAIDFYRVMEREVGSKMLVVHGREDPYQKYRG